MQGLSLVGGGISGLATACAAADRSGREGLQLRVTLFERQARVGGKARTVTSQGWLVETGPAGYLDEELRKLLALKAKELRGR